MKYACLALAIILGCAIAQCEQSFGLAPLWWLP